MSSTIDALRSSSKGKLKYDPHWHEQGRAKQVLDECASPPTLSLRSRRDVLDCSDDSMSEAASVISQQSSDVSGPHVKVTSIEPVIDSSDSMSCSSIEDSLVHSPTILNGCIEVSIMQCEKYWEKKAEFAAKLVREKQELYWKTLKVQAEQQLAALERKAELDERKAAERLQMLEMRTREESRKRQLKRKEDVKHHAVMVETKMKAVEAKRGQELGEEKKKTEEAKKILSHVSNLHHLVNLYTDRATQLLANCKHKEFITENVKNLTDHIRVLKEVSDHVQSDAQSKEMAIAELETMGKVYTKAKQVVEQTNKIVGEAEKRGNEEMERKKAAEEAEKLAQSTPAPPPPPPLPPPTTTSVPPTSKTDSTTAATAGTIPGELESNITAEAFREYKALQEKRQAILESIKDLMETKDSQLKKYRMDLQKAVNVTINTIANQSGSHLIEKVQRLHSLLSGRSVPVQATGRQVNAAQHSCGKAFCKELLAKKIVRQGGEQVSSSHDSAFPIAAVAVGVWAEFPDFGDLLLAHFHLACPYLVPYYIPKKDGQSEEDYYKDLGYSVADGNIEKQAHFLKRMTGICRLYAAILQQPSPKEPRHPHPHGLDNGWKWFSRIMNLEPRNDITATLIYDMLQVCGNKVTSLYRKQFIKILGILIKDFYPLIEKVTIPGSGGSVSRLKTFLETCFKNNAVPPPKGTLPSNLWRS